MSSMVKNVFLTLMGSIVAVMLYGMFFGVGEWNGALFYASKVVESSISRYYYEYCYLPNMHMNDSIDESLGCTVATDLQSTETFLGEEAGVVYNNVSYPSSLGLFYTTGWK